MNEVNEVKTIIKSIRITPALNDEIKNAAERDIYSGNLNEFITNCLRNAIALSSPKPDNWKLASVAQEVNVLRSKVRSLETFVNECLQPNAKDKEAINALSDAIASSVLKLKELADDCD